MDASTSSSPPPKKLKMSSTTNTSDDDDNDDDNNNNDKTTNMTATTTTAAVDDSEDPPKKQRYKRRKVAIFVAYCGVGYQGMQKNPGAKTIEGDLEEALFLSSAVPQHDRGLPKSIDWARAARTDKGVSAVGQVVSGRFYVDPPGLVDRLNSHLPPQIRIFGYKRVTASFSAKKFCDRRRYVYLLPLFALDPTAHPTRQSVIASIGSQNELIKCSECPDRGRKVAGLMGRRGSPDYNGPPAVELEPSGAESTPRDQDGRSQVTINNLQSGHQSLIESIDSCPKQQTVENAQVGKSGVTADNENSENGEKPLLGSIDSLEQQNIEKDDVLVESKAQCEEANVEKNEGIEGETACVGLDSSLSPEEENKVGKIESLCENGEKMGPVEGRKEFRYGEEERQRFNRILKYYEGTHNFHNFTTRTKAEDPSARRFIVSFSADNVVSVDGLEFVRCEVVGQSFMLHQIRKMIGLAVAVMRNCAPESLMETALRKDVNVNVPTAPEVGLYLEECLFTSYNKKWKDSHEEISMEAYKEQAEDFKMKHIYSHIASMEQKEGVVGLWLHSLNQRNYPDFCVVEGNGTYSDMECAQEVNTDNASIEGN